MSVEFVPPPPELVERPCSRCGRPAVTSIAGGEDRCGLHIEARAAA